MIDRGDILAWATILFVCAVVLGLTLLTRPQQEVMAGQIPDEATCLTYELVYQHKNSDPFVTETLQFHRTEVRRFPPWLGLSYLFSVRLLSWE